MTMKNRVQRYIGFGLIAASFGFLSGCNQIDVKTEEGLLQALETREKLDKAIPRITGMVSRPEELKPYIGALNKLYMDGSAFDREVIQALAVSGAQEAVPALMKAVDSTDYKQVIQAGYGAKELGNAEILNKLLGVYDKQVNPEVKRVILDAGTAIKSPEITKKAVEVLNGKLDDTPFALLRTSCDVLAYQADDSTVDTLMKVVYHQDGVGRTLTSNCTNALLALDKSVVAPALLNAYELKNEELMKYVAAHPDTLTPESIRNNTANSLALYRYKEAIDPMLDYLGNTKTIPVPGTLAIRPNTDPAWQMWASLVGVSAQSTIFAINDIGVLKNDRAKTILTDIFNWTLAYQSKFKNAIELTGTTNIEVSQRVNAYRALRENDLLTTEEVVEMVNSLKGEEFLDERTLRNWARASIGTDMVTYSAITARKGELDTVWAAFDAMKANEFNVPQPEAGAPKTPHFNDNVYKRIASAKKAFELADECDMQASCYAQKLEELDKEQQEVKKKIEDLNTQQKSINEQIKAKAAAAKAAAGETEAEEADAADEGVAKEIEELKQSKENTAKEIETLTDSMNGIYYARVKVLYELGLSGDHQYFETICNQYEHLDVFGQLYGTKALAQVGSKDDVDAIKALKEKLAKKMTQINYTAAKPNLDNLMTILKNKE